MSTNTTIRYNAGKPDFYIETETGTFHYNYKLKAWTNVSNMPITETLYCDQGVDKSPLFREYIRSIYYKQIRSKIPVLLRLDHTLCILLTLFLFIGFPGCTEIFNFPQYISYLLPAAIITGIVARKSSHKFTQEAEKVCIREQNWLDNLNLQVYGYHALAQHCQTLKYHYWIRDCQLFVQEITPENTKQMENLCRKLNQKFYSAEGDDLRMWWHMPSEGFIHGSISREAIPDLIDFIIKISNGYAQQLIPVPKIIIGFEQVVIYVEEPQSHG